MCGEGAREGESEWVCLTYLQKRKKKYNPSETSHDEETMEQEEAGPDNNEPHPPNNNNNNTSYVSENYHFLHTKLFSPPPSFPPLSSG